MKNNHTVGQIIKEVGLALILTFIPIGMYTKVLIGNMHIGNMLMLLGFLLLFPFRNIFIYKRIAKCSSNVKWFISFFILSFLYLFISSTTNISLEKEILYLGVSIGTCMALVNTNYEYDFKLDNVILCTLILSFLCVLCGLYFCLSGMHDYAYQFEQDIYDDLTAGFISVINICCSLYLMSGFNKRVRFNFLLFLLIMIDLYHIILTGKRTPLIIGMLCILYGIYVFRKNKQKNNIKKMYVFIGVFIVVIFIFTNKELYQSIVNLFDSIIKGLNDLVFGANFDETNSTSIRYNARKASMDDLSSYSMFEYIFGRGYMYRWMDIPFLQAYMDMGILGLILFTKNIIYIPFKCMLKYAQINRKIMWATLICFYGIFGSLTTGTPYDHAKWIYIAVLLFVLNGEKKTLKL